MMEPYQNKIKSAQERALDLLSRMSVREKVGQLNQALYGFSCYRRVSRKIELTQKFKDEVEKHGGLGVLYGLYRADPWSQKNFANGITNELVSSAYNTVQNYIMTHTRLGIPVLMSSECPHGHQALDGYLLPVNLAMGAAFHPALVESAYAVCAKQMKAMGVDLALISMLDVLRDPRWGRSEECFGEDPYLCARMAEAAVRGCQSQNVVTVAKHFCAQGEGTGGVNASAARIGERELREIHLPPAAACCEAGVGGIMTAYNEIDGSPCHANPHLLKDILRGEMHFNGIVMADGTAIDRLDALTGNNMHSGALALNSGVDVSLWDTAFSKLELALATDRISQETLDRSVLRVLKLKFERGLFDQPYLNESIDLTRYTVQDFPQSLELARESVVLLKNQDKLLPLNLNDMKTIAVIGPNAHQIYNQMGDYSPPVREGYGETLLEGMRREADSCIQIEYEHGCDIRSGTDGDREKAVALALRSDVVILALGGSSSRFTDVNFDINGAAVASDTSQMDCGEGMDCASLSLDPAQEKLAEAIFHTGKPVITVLIQGRPYAVPQVAEKTDALLCAFYPGPFGGQALAELIFGKVSPSGRLPVSVPRSTGQIPVYYNYKSSYDAMRYLDEKSAPLYPFGYGMSYTYFSFHHITISREKITLRQLRVEGIRLSFQIANMGECDGTAVPMLFIHDKQASTVRRVKELKSFAKIAVKVSETQQAELSLCYEDLAIWDSAMQFQVETGDFDLQLMDSDRLLWNGNLKVTE